MNFNLSRPYKSAVPLDTIIRIREILNRIRCLIYEEFWGNPYEEIYSVRLTTTDADGRFGTNGKGRDHGYCLASAYAEFIERLQNGLLFFNPHISRAFLAQMKRETGFYFYPDEITMPEEDYKKLPQQYLVDVLHNKENLDEYCRIYFDRLKQNSYAGCLAVPFYDCRNQVILHLPYMITQGLTGSNGMAAGNTLAEATFQGICEILERYAASEIYFKQLTPPTIPREFLKQFTAEYKIICQIEANSTYRVTVKDFSCAKGFPVLGVIIENPETKKYKLNVGSDTSFSIALSRCLTEIYQGHRNIPDFDSQMLQKPETEHTYFLQDDTDSVEKRCQQFTTFTIDGSGVYPKTLFEETTSYTFDPLVFTTRESYEEEVKHLTDLILEQGHEVYLRDVSFLGFPSVYLYITKMSLSGKKSTKTGFSLQSIGRQIDMDKIEELFFPVVHNRPGADLPALVKLLDRPEPSQHKTALKNILKLDFKSSSDWYDLPYSFLMVMLCYKNGDNERSLFYLDKFMQETDNTDDEYYKAVLEFLRCLNQQLTLEQAGDKIRAMGYSDVLIEEITGFLGDKATLFNQIELPDCPRCADCCLNEECITRNKLNLNLRVHHEMKNNLVDQLREFQRLL